MTGILLIILFTFQRFTAAVRGCRWFAAGWFVPCFKTKSTSFSKWGGDRLTATQPGEVRAGRAGPQTCMNDKHPAFVWQFSPR